MKQVPWRKRLKNLGHTLAPLTVALLGGLTLRRFDGSGTFVPLLFVLAVMLVSRMTDGYLYGIAASILATFCVNYVFTFPFFAFNFTLAGYPLTFLVMLCVSISVGALTTQIRRQEKMRAEIETEKMRANLLRAVSHDIRTPLTSIVGAADAYLGSGEHMSEARKTSLISGIREEAQWLVRVVENLLSVTRMAGGEARIRKQTEAAEEILGEAAQKFKKQFPSVKVVLHAPDELLLVPMDATLIEQVLVNLMENAVIHGGTSRIDIALTQEGEDAVFTVSDNGSGIPVYLLGKLFDGAARSDRTADGRRSMGIGLSVCRTVVQAHGGTIRGENKKEGGACFTVTLPMKGDDYED